MINKSSINMENRMQKGISFHQKGELQQAEQLYQQVLQRLVGKENPHTYVRHKQLTRPLE